MATIDKKALLALPAAERLRLAEELWDSVHDEPTDVELSSAQRAELKRRLDRIKRDGPRGVSVDAAIDRVLSRKRKAS